MMKNHFQKCVACGATSLSQTDSLGASVGTVSSTTKERQQTVNHEPSRQLRTLHIRQTPYIHTSSVKMKPPSSQQERPESTPLMRRLTVAISSDEQAEKLQRRVTSSSAGMAVAGEHMMELELEEFEWDGSTPFYKHCIAGSLAGVAEHRT